MTTKGIGATSVVALLGLLLLAWPAIADEPDSFTACIGPVQSDHCSTDDTYLAGDDLWFRGTVEPAHAGMTARARVKAPGDDRFRTVAIDTVSDEGTMRWTWKTDVSDANIEVYRLRWKIPSHGKSEVVRVQLVVSGDRSDLRQGAP